jgi:cell division protein FtsN
MARDYKNAGTRRRAAGSGFTGWIGLTIGLTLGVALAAGVHLYHTGGFKPLDDTDRRSQTGSHGDDEVAAADDEPKRPRFDFYRMLPNYEVVIPEEDIAVTPAKEEAEITVDGTYVLQAGSFRTSADADRLRAQLALLGVESRVQTVTIDDTDTWHRVRIGPMRDLEMLNTVRQRLADNEIEALVIRVGD